jgi:hypothetical protein
MEEAPDDCVLPNSPPQTVNKRMQNVTGHVQDFCIFGKATDCYAELCFEIPMNYDIGPFRVLRRGRK